MRLSSVPPSRPSPALPLSSGIRRPLSSHPYATARAPRQTLRASAGLHTRPLQYAGPAAELGPAPGRGVWTGGRAAQQRGGALAASTTAGGGRGPAGWGSSGRGNGRRGGWRQQGRGRGGGRGDSPADLPSLAAEVEARAAVMGVGGLYVAFNWAGKLGMAPGQWPRDDDPHRTELLHRTLATLAAAYLPLVPGLRDAKSCAIPLWACAKAGFWGGGLVVALLQRLGRDGGALLREANDHDHANLWWSLASAPPELLASVDVAQLLQASSRGLLLLPAAKVGPQACSNVLWGCTKLGVPDPELPYHVTASFLPALHSTKSQHVATLLYALGELREDCGHQPHPEDLQRLAAEVARRLAPAPPAAAVRGGYLEGGDRSFSAQGLSIMLRGCSKMGLTDPDLLRPLAAAAGQAAVRMKEQELANSFYALGLLGCSGAAYGHAVHRLATEVQQRLRRQPDALKPQNLSNILYALAVLGCNDPAYTPVVVALAAACKQRHFVGFNPQNVSNSAWALAKMGYDSDQAWFAGAPAAAVQLGLAEVFTPQNISNLWYALALVRHRPSAAFRESTVAASEQLRTQASGQDCSNLLWSLAKLEVPYDPRLVGALLERLGELLQRSEEVNEQVLSNSLWALAVMGPGVLSHHHRSVEGLLREVVRRWDEAGMSPASQRSSKGNAGPFLAVQLAQLWQVQQELERTDGCGELAGILAAAGKDAGSQGSLLSAMRRAFKERKAATDH